MEVVFLKEGDLEDEHEESRDASSEGHRDHPGDDNVPVKSSLHESP